MVRAHGGRHERVRGGSEWAAAQLVFERGEDRGARARRITRREQLERDVPVGSIPPVTVAVSLMVVPTAPPAEGTVAIVGVASCLLVNVHASGYAAAPVNVAVAAARSTSVVTGSPPTEHSAPTRVYPGLGVSVTVSCGVAPAAMASAAAATPLAPLTTPVVAAGAIVCRWRSCWRRSTRWRQPGSG